MNKKLNIFILTLFALFFTIPATGQEVETNGGYLVAMTLYEGEMIPSIELGMVYVYAPLKFKNEKERQEYNKLVWNVKKVYPISREINRAIIETYEYMMTLPDDKSRQKHISKVEKGLKEQYTPRMKKLTFTQGKLLIKLVDRECNQSSYELVKAFMGPFKAGLYQTFASLFGASLKKEYDPEGEDRLTERIVYLIETGQI